MSNFYPITVWPFVSVFFVYLILFPQWTSDKLDNGKLRPLLWLPMCWLLRSTYWPRQDNPQITSWVLSAPLTGSVLCICFARTWTLHLLPVSFLTLVWTLLLYNSIRTLLFPGDFGSGLEYLLCPYWWASCSILYISATSPWPLHIGRWTSQRLNPDSILEEGRVVLFP